MNSKYEILFFDETQKKEWDNLIIKNSGEFLQSWAWGDFQQQIGRKVWRLAMGDSALFATIVKHNLLFGWSYLYVPRGPFFQNVSVLEIFLREVRKIAAEEKSIFLRIEPTCRDITPIKNEFKKFGFQKTASIQPKDTLVLDLTRSVDILLKEMQLQTRQHIRHAERRGVKIIKPTELSEKQKSFEDFYCLLEATAQRNHFKIYPKNYYRQILNLTGNFNAKILTAELNKKTISAAIFIFYGTTATYLYSASATGYGRFNAPSLVLWSAILEAKNMTFRNFDFWGISAVNRRWQGLTAFKKSFGGSEEHYIGTWDISLDKKFYLAYKVLKKLIKR